MAYPVARGQQRVWPLPSRIDGGEHKPYSSSSNSKDNDKINNSFYYCNNSNKMVERTQR